MLLHSPIIVTVTARATEPAERAAGTGEETNGCTSRSERRRAENETQGMYILYIYRHSVYYYELIDMKLGFHLV